MSSEKCSLCGHEIQDGEKRDHSVTCSRRAVHRGTVSTHGCNKDYDLVNSKAFSVGDKLILHFNGLDKNALVVVGMDYGTAARLFNQIKDAMETMPK